MSIKYCDDADCPNFNRGGFESCSCRLGFINPFRVPKSYKDIQEHNWGYVMPRACRIKTKRLTQ